MITVAMGRSKDRLVKRNGKWLIESRKLTVFTDYSHSSGGDGARLAFESFSTARIR